jgi:hypothetical protein
VRTEARFCKVIFDDIGGTEVDPGTIIPIIRMECASSSHHTRPLCNLSDRNHLFKNQDCKHDKCQTETDEDSRDDDAEAAVTGAAEAAEIIEVVPVRHLHPVPDDIAVLDIVDGLDNAALRKKKAGIVQAIQLPVKFMGDDDIQIRTPVFVENIIAVAPAVSPFKNLIRQLDIVKYNPGAFFSGSGKLCQGHRPYFIAETFDFNEGHDAEENGDCDSEGSENYEKKRGFQ